MAVHSSHLLRYEELRLGERLRELRQDRGVTLKELASRVATSPARLSQIENDRLHLALEELEALTAALGVPLAALLPAEKTLPYQIARDVESRASATHPRPPGEGRDGAALAAPGVRALADLFVGRHMEPLLARIEPSDGERLQFSYDDQEQFTFVLRGSIQFRVQTPDGERQEQLARGDCLYFRSDMPHAFRSVGELPAECLHVICSSSASFASVLDRSHRRAIAPDGQRTSPGPHRTGDRLRLLREVHGWSTERVARASGLPERMVTRIERGDRAIPLDALLNLARAFGRPLRDIVAFTAVEQPYYVVQRSGDIPSIPSRQRRTPVERPSAPRSKTCHPLVAEFPVRRMYPCFLRLLNVGLDTLTLHEHHGEEFVYVLEGELELTTFSGSEEVHEVLRAGDSCYIDSTAPHLFRSWTRNPYSETAAEVLDVFWCPLGERYLFDT